MKDRDYYVYGWYYEDTKDFFYIGKGKGNRINSLKCRTDTFKELLEIYKTNNKIIIQDLDEKTAAIMENKLTETYLLLRHPLININIEKPSNSIKQREGIEKAKKAGKYKDVGRKKIKPDIKTIELLYPQWKSGKIKANEFMEVLKMKRNTFYRRIKEYEKELANLKH